MKDIAVAIILVAVPHSHQTVVSVSSHIYASMQECMKGELGLKMSCEKKFKRRYGADAYVSFECRTTRR
jgi:hypothetical protein